MNAAQLSSLEMPGRHRPLAWLMADATRVAFGACYRCAHGSDAGIERVCGHPELLDMGAPQPVAIVRAWGGGCGPDALRLCDPAIS